MRSVETLLFWLKVSRPGLWFQTVWLYTVPIGAGIDWNTAEFWFGLVYVTWPLNLLVYGWNDIVDIDIDQENPRKDSWLFGARGTRAQLKSLPPLIVLAQVPFLIGFILLKGWIMLGLVVGIVGVNATYNAKIAGLRGRPPFDLINPLGYLLVLELAIQLTDAPHPPIATYLYLALFCVHAQLIGEVMDFYPDRASGRVTSCTKLGVISTKWLIIAMVFIEGLLIVFVFEDIPLGGMLLFGTSWLVYDVLFFSKSRPYTTTEFKLAGVGMNAAGFLSMAWVWMTGSISALP